MRTQTPLRIPTPIRIPAVAKWILTIVVAAMILSACSSDPDPEQAQPAVLAALRGLYSLPEDLILAESFATGECMEREGFASFFDPTSVGGSSLNVAGMSSLSVQEAREYGYGGRIFEGGASSEEDRYVASLSEKEQVRYFDTLGDPRSKMVPYETWSGMVIEVPSGGCAAEARIAVYGSLETYLRITSMENEMLSFNADIQSDDGVVAAFEGYAECMDEAGYEGIIGFRESLEMAQERFAPTRQPGEPPTEDERAMAVTDATCQKEAKVHGALDRAIYGAAAEFLREREADILELAELRTEALRRARDVLSASG